MSEGILYIVATPIGNLNDLSPRAGEILSRVSLIAAEDTRVSGKLLQHIGVNTPMISLHEYNEQQRIDAILARLHAGESIALVSDAGTPLISDPGYPLVRAVQTAGLKLVPIPGPCALVAALSVSGLPTDRFVFEGFLPAKSSGRRARFEALQFEQRTLIFYESPHRILSCLDDLLQVMGASRDVVIARELTKTFETVHAGTVEAVRDWVKADNNQQRGELVMLVAGAKPEKQSYIEQQRVLKVLMAELPVKQAATLAAQICGAKRNELYQQALEIKATKTK